MDLSFSAKLLGAAATAAYALLLALVCLRYFGEALGLVPDPVPALREGKTSPWRAVRTVGLAFLLSRLLFFLAPLVLTHLNGGAEGYLQDLPGTWVRWDAYHYIKIAQQWYVNVGDDKFKIVFYPLYPLVVQAVSLTGLTARTSAYLVSNACLVGSGFALYGLLLPEQGARGASRAVWLMMFCPLGLFFSIPYSESLFLLLCLLTAWAARRQRFGMAALFGALCSATRALGILTAPVLFFALLSAAWRDYAATRPDARRMDPAFLGRAALAAVRTAPVALGLLWYLLINYQVTGNPLTFLTYQAEHWSQTFGSLANTLTYSLVNAFEYGDFNYRVCLWIPQVICILGVLALLWAGWRRLHAGDAAFAVLYFYCAVAPTWLLSGPRYLGALYALYPLLALLTRRRGAFALALGLSVALGAYMSAQYIVAGCVL